MLKTAYLLAKIGADTAENERNFAKKLATEVRRGVSCDGPAGRRPAPLGSATAPAAAAALPGGCRLCPEKLPTRLVLGFVDTEEQ